MTKKILKIHGQSSDQDLLSRMHEVLQRNLSKQGARLADEESDRPKSKEERCTTEAQSSDTRKQVCKAGLADGKEGVARRGEATHKERKEGRRAEFSDEFKRGTAGHHAMRIS